MSDCLEIRPLVRPIAGSIRPPGSKSLTNRALILAALADGASHLAGVLFSRDTEVMIDSLRRLGLSVEQNAIFHFLLQANPRLRAALCAKGDCDPNGVPVELPKPGDFEGK